MSIAPSQILYLEHGSSRLYAEAIQIVEARRLCWARPTLLIHGLPEENSSETSLADRQAAIAHAATHLETSTLSLYNLKDGPDLIWPTALFSIAFDIDFFALLIRLKLSPDDSQLRSQQQLSAFVRSFWLAHTDTFKLNLAEPGLPESNSSAPDLPKPEPLTPEIENKISSIHLLSS
ncbi:MAG: hypothetical protein DCF25_17560 [Leptolyngbya foveolarum]|uniref:Uncharacterized protein n=1 Tax=Leptolyngbya foveolarum TaxID=47253 RepID=A0A2W4W062_9CYAN|nr:MAG: hypothetical protein DCF25_17560 [Leptolyngbya foveolarum]